MATTLITKNSVVGSKRPTAAQLVTGELGLNAEASDPGLYFEDSNGDIRKIGGTSYGPTAPNSSAAGETGNSVGELWYDTTTELLNVWDGTAWVGAGDIDTHSFTGTGVPTLTVRPDGTALMDGDMYFDDLAGQERAYRYLLATTSWVNIDSKTFTQDTVPPAAATFDNDYWYDSTFLTTFIYYNDGSSQQWVQLF